MCDEIITKKFTEKTAREKFEEEIFTKKMGRKSDASSEYDVDSADEGCDCSLGKILNLLLFIKDAENYKVAVKSPYSPFFFE